ncbi:MAG TPA: hypothetical protein VIL55_11735 [Naasia sp.]
MTAPEPWSHPDLVHYGEPVVPAALGPTEVVALLVVALGFDGRIDPDDELTQIAWSDIADRAGWTYPEAVDAIRAHYLESDGFVTPAAVTRLIRARRALVERERAKAEQLAEVARHRELTASNLRPDRAAHRARLRRIWRTLTAKEST